MEINEPHFTEEEKIKIGIENIKTFFSDFDEYPDDEYKIIFLEELIKFLLENHSS